jgi:uncharacterized phage protein (TIGR02216 family)
MTACFGDLAVRLSGLAARTLGWLPQNFWAATPAELAAALSLGDHPQAAGLDRAALERLMEKDHG